MKTYPLEPIRALRMRKEEEAGRKLAAARAQEAHCQGEVTSAQKALEDYRLWMEEEASRLFQRVLGKLHPIHQVTDVTHQISWNRSKQSTYVVALDEARKQLEEAKQETERCLHEHEEAYKEVWKINQHHDFWKKEQMLQEAQAEEADIEEIAATIFAMREVEE